MVLKLKKNTCIYQNNTKEGALAIAFFKRKKIQGLVKMAMCN